MVENADFERETMPMSFKNKRLKRPLADASLQMDPDEGSENDSGSEQPMAHASAGDVFLTGRAINSLRTLSVR